MAMPKRLKSSISNPFLDVEAHVDNESEEENGDTDSADEDFIDNNMDFEYEPEPSSSTPLNRELSPSVSTSDAVDLTRYEDNDDPDSDLEDIIEDILADIPGLPYWRIACKAGMEQDVVDALETSAERYKQTVRSTFHPTLRTGWIYIQAQMTERLKRILLNTRGVLRRGKELVIRTSTPDEFLGVLRSDEINVKHSVNVDQWIGVARGAYKGDPAVVVSVDGDLVDVVVVPRVNQTKKRKAPGVRPSPTLFDAKEYQQVFPGKTVRSRGEDLFSVGACEFEFGLLRLSLAWEGVDPIHISLPTQILDLFQRSRHPAIKRAIYIPKPLEWCMGCGDKVLIPLKKQRGIISSVEATQVYVDVGDAGIAQTRWNAVRKAIGFGDYVEIGAGPCTGVMGWVVSQVEQTCIVIQSKEGTNEIEEIPVHVNWLKTATAPVHLPKPARVLNTTVKDYMPWRNARVIITKLKDPNKGKPGKVIDVVKHQDASRPGVRLVLELEDYNPNLPFSHITVDSEDVVDANTHLKLGQKGTSSSNPAPEMPTVNLPPPSLTPMHSTSFDDFTAPEPPSATPDLPCLSSSSDTNAVSSVSSPLPVHPLLNPLLADITLKATVTGSKYKNSKLDVKVVNVDGRLSLQHKTFRTWNTLEPAWVQPQHPHVSRDNSLRTIPICDGMGRICVLLGGIPGGHRHESSDEFEFEGTRDANVTATRGNPLTSSATAATRATPPSSKDSDASWIEVQDAAFDAIRDLRDSQRLKLPQKYFKHRRGEFPCVPVGISHGGGQPSPRRLTYEKNTSELLDSLIRKPCFQRIAGFTNSLFKTYFPRLHEYYDTTITNLVNWSSTTNLPIVKNYEHSAFACTSVNMGPRTYAFPHLDYGNLSFGLCALTALGDFNPDEGGHLALWDLRLAIRFPPGSTLFLPSAVMEHLNTPIQKDEERCSFAQYSAGGIFRWVDYGFRSEQAFFKSISEDEVRIQEEQEAKTNRWKKGLDMYSTISELRNRRLLT
ncbi:hypothetical protein CVT24_012809 [Panaeolus cyanescens]|uniref:NGN domain-containing protein n=1 Tax=Panaeolus cyanescens TaxID=181874 RepID=A0A409YJS2_9AGAR|nr:hypothetical protein CVT24_012809 [Panaeolus cyanescens]